jgi:hypothetical protein
MADYHGVGREGLNDGFGEMGLDVYWKILEGILSPQSLCWGAWKVEAEGIVQQLGPRDGVEKLMVDQILWLHARLGSLSVLASLEKKADKAAGLHAACDRLADTVRRHVSAFCAYRYPERKRFVAVKRANIAQQQIVISGGKKRGRPRLETGNLKLETRQKGTSDGLNIGGIVSFGNEAAVSAGLEGGGKEEALHLPAEAVGDVDGASDEAGEVEG